MALGQFWRDRSSDIKGNKKSDISHRIEKYHKIYKNQKLGFYF